MFGKNRKHLFTLLTFIAVLCQPAKIQSQQISKADSLLKTGNFEEAAKFFKQQVESTKDSAKLTKAYVGLGKSQLVRSQFDEALKNYLSAEKYNANHVNDDLLEIYIGMGVINSKLRNFERAEFYLDKALSQARQENIQRLKILINLAGVYVETKNKKDLATYQQAMVLAKKLDNLPIQAVIHTNLSNYYIEEANWELARQHGKASLEIRESLQLPGSVITFNNYGYALVQLGQIENGIAAYQQGMEQASLQEKERLLFNLMNANRAFKNYREALKLYEDYDAIKDSIAGMQYREKIADIQTAYETKQNKKQIEFLEIDNANKERELRYWIIGAFIALALLSVIALLYSKNQRVKQELVRSKLHQRLLQVQLNPHFLFNALQQIQLYIFSNEKEKSMEYLSNFSRLIRLILETSNHEYLSLEEELEMLKKYLCLQQSAASPQFNYQFKLDITSKPDRIKIPVMLLQSFVENAVLHGVKDHPNGEIEIIFKEDRHKKQLIVEIKDNGKGIKEAEHTKHQRLHISMGSDIITDRIKEYNKTHHRNIELEIIASQPAKKLPGTRIILTIPYKFV